MTFKIGDSVIMTADSGKGEIFNTKTGRLLNGEYEAIIVESNKGYPEKHDTVWVILKGIHEPDTWYFNSDGSCYTHPGMSIRLAKEEVAPTPSQWIEGKAPIPKKREEGIAIWGMGFNEPIYISKYEEIHREVEYTHWQYVQLPPPPPAKEVEAFGFLEWYKRAKSELHNPDKPLVMASEGYTFYSQPATAEVLNKYIKPDANFLEENKEITLDSWIIRCSNSYSHELLFFTPAALDKLGIK